MNRLRVLIGEDESVAAEGLRAKLERMGHTVAGIAYDGRDAAAKAESLAPDLIFLDIKMPRLDGLEATREIMAHRPVPIILVTAHSDPDLIQRATAAGVMGYLVKPVGLKELGPAIAVALSRFADLTALRKDVQGLKEALLVRQQVERAKGILAQRMGLSEAEAHKRIQHLAMRERCTLAEAAARVIAANTFFADLETVP
jgi:response regulator NasT